MLDKAVIFAYISPIMVFNRLKIMIALLMGKAPIPKDVKIGKSVYIGRKVKFDWIANGSHIVIGDNATIVDGVRILCHDASSNRRLGVTWVAPVKIGNRAYVGADSIILPGVSIGDDAVVGAGSVVTKNVDAGVVVAGVPAKPIGSVYDLDEKRKLLMATMKCYDVNRYSKYPLNKELVDELESSILKDGGYFLSSQESNLKKRHS